MSLVDWRMIFRREMTVNEDLASVTSRNPKAAPSFLHDSEASRIQFPWEKVSLTLVLNKNKDQH
jgi:hypothetical protein